MQETTIGSRLRMIREENHLLQKDLAKIFKCSQRDVSNIENDKQKMNINQLAILRFQLKIDLDWLLFGMEL